MSTASVADPSLDSLVPRPTAGRNLALLGLAAALGTVAWFSPTVLAPTLRAGDVGGGAWQTFGTDGVLTTSELSPAGWPSLVVESVEDVPGAHVVGAWVLPPEAQLLGSPTVAHPESLALEDVLPGVDLGPATALPQRLSPGQTGHLLVRWEITDCQALVATDPPVAVLRSAIGPRHREVLQEWAGPAFDLTLLVDSGACPAP